MTARLLDVFGTAYIAPHHSVELDQFLTANNDVDIAGCRIAKDAMKVIDNKIAERKNIFDSEDSDREFALKQAREKACIDTSQAIELPKLEEMKLLNTYLKSLRTDVEYCIKGDYSREYLYPLLTLINMYKPSVVIQISDKYFELGLYINKTLYRRGCKAIFDSSKEFVLIFPDSSRVVEFNAENVKQPIYVYGYGEVSFESLTAKAVVLPTYFGNKLLVKDPELNELWKDVKETAIVTLDRYFSIRRETIKSFLGCEEQDGL